jgi:hypothetical protein
MEFLKRLFGLGSSRRATPASTRAVTAVALPPKKGDSSQMYFDAMGRFHQAFAQRDYAKAARLARENMAVIPAWIAATKKELGEFVIGSIPALHDGGRALALIGDDAGLLEMQRLIEQNAALKDWAELIPALQNERRLFVAIVEAVKASPGLMLVELKARVNETDGVRLSSLVRFLEKAGRVVRVKDSRGFKIFPPGAVEIPPEPPKRAVASHRVDRSRPRLHEINITQLDYVPLPRAPLKWEEAHSGRVPERPAEPTEPFEVRDAPWRIEKVEKIPSGERPNTAFRVNRFCGSGLFVIDDLGKSETVGGAPSAAIHYDRTGSQTARRGLLHDIYRHGVHPLGRHLIAMSKARVLHAYDDNLNPMLETDLTLAPEISAIRTRFDIADAELKNHIRCVAMSRDASRYLFTTVDEAWCISEDGQGLWGAKHPVKDGWTQFATPSAVSGTSADVAEALSVMELTLPVTPDEVKARYRALAKR